MLIKHHSEKLQIFKNRPVFGPLYREETLSNNDCMLYTERSDVEGGAAAEVGTVATETRSLLSIQCRRSDAVNGHIHCARSLACMYLVFHWT